MIIGGDLDNGESGQGTALRRDTGYGQREEKEPALCKAGRQHAKEMEQHA